MNFGLTNDIGQSTSNFILEPNKIHNVKFIGAEKQDYTGRDNKVYKVIRLKFEGENSGYFTDTIFEPKEEDSKRRSFDRTDGSKIYYASNMEVMTLKIKHILNYINPELAAKIDSGEVTFSANGWDAFRDLTVKSLIGPNLNKITRLKLSKNNKGESCIPRFTMVDKEGKAKVSSNFFGDAGVFFSDYEMKQINGQSSSPSGMSDLSINEVSNDLSNLDISNI